jgi:hypothetical protein
MWEGMHQTEVRAGSRAMGLWFYFRSNMSISTMSAVCPVGLTMVNELLDDIDLTKLSAVLRKLLLLRREESPLAPIRANELILVVTHLVDGPAILFVARRMIAEPLAVHFPRAG